MKTIFIYISGRDLTGFQYLAHRIGAWDEVVGEVEIHRLRTGAAIRISEWVEAGLEQAELIAFGVGQDVPLLVPRLADVCRARAELQKPFELGVLIAVGGVDVGPTSQAHDTQARAR